MLEFKTIDDILDFAIVQEIAARELYTKLSGETPDRDRQLFYRTLAEEEAVHEKKLRELKRRQFDLNPPDMQQLQDSGYLDALPLTPEMTLREVVRYALKKEKSARMLYKVLADSMLQPDLADLFRELAAEEAKHAAFFSKEYDALAAEQD